ncbi:hypothetical protein F5Y17DRAFT_415294 [Xylariaceae sp. FL0594]|nr:hypothetical protein F5Y17DRAFT_415294 [Xylariaceae sp. FL0594]
MEQPPEQIQSELESFRQQWREEVSSRSRNTAASSQQQRPANRAGPTAAGQLSAAAASATARQLRRHEPPAHTKRPAPSQGSKGGQIDDDEDYTPAPVFEVDDRKAKSGPLPDGGEEEKPREPTTALEIYEHAVERESTGKLGDSLQLYRKAYRMDDKVDRKYREKHFAGRWAKPAQQQPGPSNAAMAVPNTAHHSREGGQASGKTVAAAEGEGEGEKAVTLSYSELIASFAHLTVEGVPPEIEGAEPPPCPISELPDEVLVHILRDVAIADVGDFMRLAQVCKRLAYLVITEDRIWRRVCLGSEFGFGSMHRHWQRTITWDPLDPEEMVTDSDLDVGESDLPLTLEELEERRAASSRATTLALFRSVGGYPSWQAMFRRRPRVRFNGCYISTVNYIRPGQNVGQHLAWNTPVHIVTYYRYLRLFRDGTAISLTTTDEPAHVVHQLTRANLALHRGEGSGQHLPSNPMLKGRWRLSSLRDHERHETVENNTSVGVSGYNSPRPPDIANAATASGSAPGLASAPAPGAVSLADSESDLYVETEGVVGAKYMYRMDLTLRSAGKASARNNKLVWRGFWSYNTFTDDWAQFSLRNGKPFFFSRVKSYDPYE